MIFMTQYSVIQGSLVIVRHTGVLITGMPGTGKSMAAINLGIRGAVVVCDELVRIHKTDDGIIVGEPVNSPALIEVRGLGIFRLKDLFPTGTAERCAIDVVVELDRYDADVDLGRTEPETGHADFFGMSVPRFRAPIANGVGADTLVEMIVRIVRSNGMIRL